MDNWDDDVEDVNGFSRRSFNIMLIVGWLTFLMSGVFNFGYYKVHPRYACIIHNQVERFLYYSTVRVSNKIFPSTYMEAVALTVKATQARQHQHSSLRLSCYLLMWAVAYLVK